MAASPPPIDLLAYEPPISLWSLVESYVGGYERGEIKCILGESLVEQSLELQQEVRALLEIWRDYRAETEENTSHMLPEPPDARDRLRQEIQFFVDNLRVKARENGRDVNQVLSRHNKDVIDYALNANRPQSCSSRPSTSCSIRDGRDTPMMMGTPTSDGMSYGSSLSEEIESMNEKLNILELDEVAQHLRETLEDEVSHLLRDIDFLQHCLEDEADYRVQSPLGKEPTLTDLREERTKLEKELLSDQVAVPPALREKSKPPQIRKFTGSGRVDSGKLRPLANPTGCSSHSQQKVQSPGSPLKASHRISGKLATTSPAHHSMDIGGLRSKCSQDVLVDCVGPTIRGGAVDCNENTLEHDLLTDSDAEFTLEDTHSDTKLRPNSGHGGGGKSTAGGSGGFSIPAPTHIAIKTASLGASAKGVQVGAVPVPPKGPKPSAHVPSPPPSAKPGSARPGSASRFRKMIVDCRDGT